MNGLNQKQLFCTVFYVVNLVYLVLMALLYVWVGTVTANSVLLFLLGWGLVIYAPLNIIFYYWIFKKFKMSRSQFGLSWGNFKVALWVSLALAAILIAYATLLWAIIPTWFPPWVSDWLYPTYNLVWLSALAGSVFGVSLLAEGFYRGLVLPTWTETATSDVPVQRSRLIIVILVQAIAYSMVQLLPDVIYAQSIEDLAINLSILFGVGIWLGFCYYKTRSLFFVIGMHVLYNLIDYISGNLYTTLPVLVVLSILSIYVFAWMKAPRSSTVEKTEVAIFLENLVGVTPHVLAQIDRFGIQSIEDLAGKSPGELAIDLDIDPAVTGEWIRRARDPDETSTDNQENEE
jgi:membrane protease YdiL (CAAX protease family)